MARGSDPRIKGKIIRRFRALGVYSEGEGEQPHEKNGFVVRAGSLIDAKTKLAFDDIEDSTFKKAMRSLIFKDKRIVSYHDSDQHFHQYKLLS